MKIAKFGEMFFDAKGNVTLKGFHFSGDEKNYRSDYQAMSIDMLEAVASHFNDLIADIKGANKSKLPTSLNIHIEHGNNTHMDIHKQAERERVLYASKLFLLGLFCRGRNNDTLYYDEFTGKVHNLASIAKELNIARDDNDGYWSYYRTRFDDEINKLMEMYAEEITNKSLSEDM